MIYRLVESVGDLSPVLQFLAVFVIGVVPFLESHVGAFVGTLAGVPVWLAAVAAIVGNLVAIVVAVWAGSAVARRVAARGAARRSEGESPRRQRVLRRVGQFGVPVASLLGPIVLATALSTFIMIGAGLDRRQVVVWQVAAVVLWGVAFAALGMGALNAVT